MNIHTIKYTFEHNITYHSSCTPSFLLLPIGFLPIIIPKGVELTPLTFFEACPRVLDAAGWSGLANLDASRSATARLLSLIDCAALFATDGASLSPPPPPL